MRHATFIFESQIRQANRALVLAGKSIFARSQTRRNIIIDGDQEIEPKSFLGKKFTFGDVWFRGFEEATPCKIPGGVQAGGDFVKAFGLSGGGIRAEILGDGEIKVGDQGFLFPES